MPPVARGRDIQYAEWLHPSEFGNEVKQEKLNFYQQFIRKGFSSLMVVSTAQEMEK
jgi:hypothetical protein